MPRLPLTIEEQFVDIRSNQRSYHFKVENNGSDPVTVIGTVPRIPDGVRVVEVKNPTESALQERISALYGELEDIEKRCLRLLAESGRLDATIPVVKSSRAAKFAKALIFFPTWLYSYVEDSMKNPALQEDLFIRIHSLDDADDVYKAFIESDSNIPASFTSSFKAKCRQLEVLLAEAEEAKNTLPVVSSDSFYALTYVLEFPRKVLDQAKYSFSIELLYYEGAYATESQAQKAKVPTKTVAQQTSLLVSPRPFMVSLVAILGAILGVVLLEASQHPGNQMGLEKVADLLRDGKGVAAVLLALVFFNIFEFTSFSAKLAIGVNWRSALLIGTLCGLGTDKILKSLQAFLS